MIPEPGDTNREVPVNETSYVQTDDELTEKELKQIEAYDQAIQTILLGLPENIYAAVDSCETAQEIWLRVQQMMKGSNIRIQEKKAKFFNEWERNQNGLIGVPENANQNLNGNGNLVAACAERNAAGHNGNQIRCYNCRGEESRIQLQAEEFDLMAAAADLDEIEETDQPSQIFGDFKSLAKEADESLAKPKALELEIDRLLKAVVSQNIMSVVQKASIVDTSNLQTNLERTKERFENYIIKKENEYAKLWNDWYKKCEECKFDKISYDKAYKDMQQKIERLQAQLGDLKGKSKDNSCVSDTLNPLSQKLENENVELEFQVLNYAKENAHLKTTYKNLFDSISLTRT
nr:hypothetical protein [Tanacetum cinerariifolium]